jgi:YVTN family beta-propeller protein
MRMIFLERIVSSSSNVYVADNQSDAINAAITGNGELATPVPRFLLWPTLQRYTNDNNTFVNYSPPVPQDPDYVWAATTTTPQLKSFAVSSLPYNFNQDVNFDIFLVAFADNAMQAQIDLVDATTNTIISTLPLGTLLTDGFMDPATGVTTETTIPYNWENIRYYTINTGTFPPGNYKFVVSFNVVNYDNSPKEPNPAALAFNVDISSSEAPSLPTSVYVTTVLDNLIKVIDAATNTVLANAPAGVGPSVVAVNPTTNQVYVTNQIGGNVTVFDETDNSLIATVPVGGDPVGVAANPTSNKIYVANLTTNNVSVIDGSTNNVIATITVGVNPYWTAVDQTTNRIYVTNNAAGLVSVIDGNTDSVIATVTVGAGATSLAVNPLTHHIFVANSLANNVSVIEGSTNSVIATVTVGANPIVVAVNPTTNRVYVTNQASDNVSVIDGNTNSVIATITGPGPGNDAPTGIAVNPTTNRIYIANQNPDFVSVYDGSSNSLIATISVFGPLNIAITS